MEVQCKGVFNMSVPINGQSVNTNVVLFVGTPAWASQTAAHPPPGFHAATNTLHHSLASQENTQPQQQPLTAAAGEGLQ